LPVVLVGGPADRSIASEVLAGASTPIVSLVGETSVEQLAAVLSRANLVLSSDSGPLHLAVALDRPVVGVYGPTDPRIHGPYVPHAPATVLRRDLVCSPCYSMAAAAECPLGDPICMRLVSVAGMVRAALAALDAAA
jgi:ADP-heptose:LPS heptosyltransferase